MSLLIKNIYTLNFINNWSEFSAKHIYNNIKDFPNELICIRKIIEKLKKCEYEDSDYTEESYIELLAFGFKFIYGAIVKGGLLLSIAWLLNILIPTLVVAVSFGSIRIFAGGLHFENYTKCTYVSLATLLLGGVLCKYLLFYYMINIIIFVFTLVMFILYAPVKNINKPLKYKENSKFKTIAIVNLLFLLGIQTLVNDNIIKQSIMFGFGLAGIITLPIINKLK